MLIRSGAGLTSLLAPAALASAAEADGPLSHRHPPGRLVDPELWYPALLKPPSVNATTLAAARAGMSGKVPAFLARPAVSTRTIPGLAGSPEVRITLINAGGTSALSNPRPMILHFHGGGFVAGSAAGEVAMMQQIAQQHDCIVVSVDYRLAPETRFPGPLNDNYAALKWAWQHADELGGDRKRIALMGVSAGGGHAAMLSAVACDRGEVPIRFQLLISPMLDDRTGITTQVAPDVGKLVWTVDSNRFGWSSLLGVAAGARRVPDGAVPARRHDLSGLPATYIGVGAIDLFVSENLAFANRLIEAGVPTELNVVPGAYHVFFAIRPDAAVSRRFRADFAAALGRAFAATAGSS